MVICVAEQQAAFRLVDDQTNVAAHPYRPKVLVFRPVELVEAQPRTCRIHLQVEGRRFDGFLLVASEAGEAVGERVGDAEFHGC